MSIEATMMPHAAAMAVNTEREMSDNCENFFFVVFQLLTHRQEKCMQSSCLEGLLYRPSSHSRLSNQEGKGQR